MAVVLVAVVGKILLPDGGSTGGDIEVRLSPAGSTDDGGTEVVVGGMFTTPIATDGSVSFNIIPNDVILPTGSKYNAKIILADGREFDKVWDIATGTPQDIGDL